jgi:hypothetical protein
VPTFADIGCRVVSAADLLRPYSRFSRPEQLLFLSSSSSIVLTRLSGPRSLPTTSQKIWREDGSVIYCCCWFSPAQSSSVYPLWWDVRSVFCHPFVSRAQVKVKVMLRPTVSQSVRLIVKFTLEIVTGYYFLSESCCVISVGRPLYDERSGLSPVSHCHQCLVHCQRFNIIYNVHVTSFKYMQYILDLCQHRLSTADRSRSRSHITIDNQSANPSWRQAPIWDPQPIFLSLWDFLLDSYGLLFCNTISDERTGQ